MTLSGPALAFYHPSGQDCRFRRPASPLQTGWVASASPGTKWPSGPSWLRSHPPRAQAPKLWS